MGQTKFYRDFQESFMSWFEEQTHKEQVEMLKGIVGKPITKAMLAEYDGNAYDMAEDQELCMSIVLNTRIAMTTKCQISILKVL